MESKSNISQEFYENYKQAEDEREKHTNSILKSNSNKRIVVAGPGTGKTFLFKRILEGKKILLPFLLLIL
jgi:ATP-dependent protease Clp ATPase subunit